MLIHSSSRALAGCPVVLGPDSSAACWFRSIEHLISCSEEQNTGSLRGLECVSITNNEPILKKIYISVQTRLFFLLHGPDLRSKPCFTLLHWFSFWLPCRRPFKCCLLIFILKTRPRNYAADISVYSGSGLAPLL